MPNVRNGSQVNRGGYHSKSDMVKTERDAFARDDISHAYAGEENRGPFNEEEDGEKDSSHSTNVKGRVTEKSKERTPKR
jgi:Arc/MetJ-type ribon-helix-helix transcriptional regulator